MKAFLAAAFLVLGFSVAIAAEDQYMILRTWSSVKTKDGVTLKLSPGDWVPYAGKNTTGSWYAFTIAGMEGSVPWHDAKFSPATPQIRAAYKGVVERLKADYSAEIAKREAARERAIAKAQERAEQEAAARDRQMQTRLLSELQNISDQLEIMNRRRR